MHQISLFAMLRQISNFTSYGNEILSEITWYVLKFDTKDS